MDFLTGILDDATQALLGPVIVALFVLVVLALFFAGATICEYFTERRHLKCETPKFIDELENAKVESFARMIDSSGLLKRQRAGLIEIVQHSTLPEDTLTAVAKRVCKSQQEHYARIIAKTDVLSKIAPMVGLMGTLIPLGPGILSLSTGNTEELASALLVAFDTTVVGLVAAAIAIVVSKVRGLWYDGYLASFDAVATACLVRILRSDESERVGAAATAKTIFARSYSGMGVVEHSSAQKGGLESGRS